MMMASLEAFAVRPPTRHMDRSTLDLTMVLPRMVRKEEATEHPPTMDTVVVDSFPTYLRTTLRQGLRISVDTLTLPGAQVRNRKCKKLYTEVLASAVMTHSITAPGTDLAPLAVIKTKCRKNYTRSMK